ncbi:MAG: hypothetical protein LQ338_001706 [Usnochroma carphineum]|nr:MAG: hypothetical protein LQ338_001706 [Usnochroma carphineum]
MGVKPPLPAPTESSTLQTSGGSVTGTDLATNVSRRTDKTSFSIPEDGSPVTITTKKRRENRDKDREHTLTKASHHSQTSLLIEYFEGGKGPNVHARPSVRVKVTPSAARKIKDANEHIQLTEVGSNRKPSYTRRISLGPKSSGENRTTQSADETSISSYNSAADDSNVGRGFPPVEIEVMKGEGSDLSAASVPADKRYIDQTASEISSMPPDSMLEGNGTYITPKRTRSRSISRDAIVDNNTLKTPSRRRSRSLSKERLTQKVIEKLGKGPREVSSDKRRSSGKSASRSASKEHVIETSKPSRRRSSRHHHDEVSQSGAESILTDASPKRKSGDQYSFRSGTSKSSINNPKLLETVEDAIRRLILPELTSLKEEQKMHQNRDKFERGDRDSIDATSSMPRDTSRRVSRHASAPDVNPKVVLNRDENNSGVVLSGDSVKGRKEARPAIATDSPSTRSFERELSEETVIRGEDKVSRKKSRDGHRLRDAAAGGINEGILTAQALRHHDSKSSVESRERRRRRRSKSHSRSGSIAETEEIFQKHDVPPMPMRSDIYSSELTRDSILSDRTEEPASPSVDLCRKEIRQVSRGSPREVLSPASRTPTRTPLSGKGFGMHHSNHSRGNLSIHNSPSERSLRSENHKFQTAGLESAAVAGAGALAAKEVLAQHDTYNQHEDDSFAHRAQSRGLSPIQSVASYREEEDPTHHETIGHAHSSGSLSSLGRKSKENSGLSIKSLSSVASTNIARSNRPKGINMERPEEVLEQHGALRDSTITQSESPSRDHAMDDWYERQHEENDRYRDSYANSSDPRIDIKHLTNYTDDSADVVTDARHVQDIGANPEYIHTPVAVESAVASLHDPSVLSVRSKFGNKSAIESDEGHGEYVRDTGAAEYLEYQKYEHPEELDPASQSVHLSPHPSRDKVPQSPAESPRQSIAKSLEEHEDDRVHLGASGLPDADNPMPEIGHIPDSEDSDLNTNPSIIQGPIGGVQHGSRDHWPYQETPPTAKAEFPNRSHDSSAHDSLKAVAKSLLSKAALAKSGKGKVDEHSRDGSMKENEPPLDQDGYDKGVKYDFEHGDSYSPAMNKDEGYVSAQQHRSPGPFSPENKGRSPGIFEDPGTDFGGGMAGDEDPFVEAEKHARHLSGYSQGMPSPLYDSATGRGMDRIQSKDIVALMDHLTVRDGQRNARDTEILVTLVRSAAEMRNSFEDMRNFIAKQDGMIIATGDKQHERTAQKIINGPRPQPLGTPRIPRPTYTEDEMGDDLPKKKNVFRRALSGLGGRNSNDLARIENMLLQLLGEVEDLKVGQGLPSGSAAQSRRQDIFNNVSRESGTDGYEPEGQAGTSSTGNHSAYFSTSSPRQGNAMRSSEGRRGSQNRVSTVLEGDEELDIYDQNVLENNGEFLTPTREYPRAGSVPLATPPQTRLPTGAQSNEHTPKTGTDKSRKHKSSSSSFFPKISRWSKTTASSTGDNVRNSRQQPRPLSEASRSGSDLQYNAHDHYDPQGDDRLRSNDSLANDPMSGHYETARPRSPLVPSTISEDPKYQAHRNSLNLQHPQPRPGPTHRYQTQLESRAHDFGSPISPTSDTWGSNPSLARFAPMGPGNRHSGNAGYLSPISDAGGSEASSAADQRETTPAPPRPPKLRDDGGPLMPVRPPKVKELSQEHLRPEQRFSSGSLSPQQANGSPRSASGANVAAVRKPTGPRPITSSGSYSPDKMGRARYRSSPNRVGGDDGGF